MKVIESKRASKLFHLIIYRELQIFVSQNRFSADRNQFHTQIVLFGSNPRQSIR